MIMSPPIRGNHTRLIPILLITICETRLEWWLIWLPVTIQVRWGMESVRHFKIWSSEVVWKFDWCWRWLHWKNCFYKALFFSWNYNLIFNGLSPLRTPLVDNFRAVREFERSLAEGCPEKDRITKETPRQ